LDASHPRLKLAAVVAAVLVIALLARAALPGHRGDEVAPRLTATPASGAVGTVRGSVREAAGVGLTATMGVKDPFSGEYSDWRVYQSAFGTDVVVAITESYTRGHVLQWRHVLATQPDREMYRQYDENGELYRQMGSALAAEVPPYILELAGGAPGRANRMGRFIDEERYPVLDQPTIDELVASGEIVAVGNTSILGLEATEYEATTAEAPITRAKAWLTHDGIRLRSAQWLRGNTGEPDIVFEAVAVDTTIGMGEMYLTPEYLDSDPGSDPNVATDYLASQEFDPTTGHEAPVPEAEGLLYPRAPVSQTFTLKTSAFITGTVEGTLYEWAPPTPAASAALGERYWWVVQQLVGRGASATVIQGPEAQALPPVVLPEAWPPAWPPDEPSPGYRWANDAHENGVFADAVPYDTYRPVVSDPRQLPHWVPDALVTWTESTGVRVVLLASGLSRAGAVTLAERYRDAARAP